jgi:AcrR family transcriptional regulator
VCAERGFDGTTLAAIAARAGVTPTAIYNHFESREALLYAAGVRGLERITALASGSSGGPRTMSAVASAYLRPEMRETRRLIAELHLASARDPRLAELLAAWHRAWADTIVGGLPPADTEPRATVKALYLVLLGLCHFDDLASVRAPRAAVAERVESLVAQLVPDQSPPP